MNYSVTYIPKPKKIKWKLWVSLFIVVTIGLYVTYQIHHQRQQDAITTYGICGFTNKQTRQKIKNSLNSMPVSEHLYYGETLNLFHEPFVLNQKDFFHGKTLTLVNVCNGLDYAYVLEKKVDGQIPLETLEPGYYEVYVNDNFKAYRLYFNEKRYDTFYTVTRNQTNRKIEVIADQSLFKEEQEENYLDRHYMFIKVSEEMASDEHYDVILDPGHLTKDDGWLERGITVNDLNEAEETYKLAVLMKKYLEEAGLKVLITRDDQSFVNSYGKDGRLYKAYSAHGKYFIELQLKASTNPSIRGTQVIHSSFSSNKLASSILESITSQTNLVATANRGKGKVYGVLASVVDQGFDGRMMIRESGGKILGAGLYSQRSRNENGTFNAESPYGMQAVTIEYIYMSNAEDVEVWKHHLDDVAASTVHGLLVYLGIE